MLTLNYSVWSLFFLLCYVYIEIFNSIIFYSVFKNLKDYFINYSKKQTNNLNIKNLYNFILNFLFIYFLFLKCEFVNNYIMSILLFYIIILKCYKNSINSEYLFLLFNVIFCLILFSLINSFVMFFLFIELYSIFFYFFFINKNQNNYINMIQYKNMLLLYLFNNFFSTILYLLGMYFLIFFYGTLSFTELQYLIKTPHIEIYLIVISFMIKLSLPGLHFLKIEIYKYLSFDSLIIYSIITLFVNYIFIITFFNQNVIYINLNNYKLFNILILFSFIVFIQKLKLNNFHEFIAYSGFSTNTLIIINYII